MLTNPKLVMTDVPDDEARVWILEGLAAENRAHVHEPGLRHLTILIKHPGPVGSSADLLGVQLGTGS